MRAPGRRPTDRVPTKRFMNASVVSQSSRQPLSIVSRMAAVRHLDGLRHLLASLLLIERRARAIDRWTVAFSRR